MRRPLFKQIIIVGMVLSILAGTALAQTTKPAVRTVTIPISIFTKKELKERETSEFVQADRLTVVEDKDQQQILSIRSVTGSPLALAILIQDDLAGNFNLQIDDIREFIR